MPKMTLPTPEEFAETSLRAVQLNRRAIVDMLSSQPGKDKLLRFLEYMNANFEVMETSLALFLGAAQRREAMSNASGESSTAKVHGSGAGEEEGREADPDQDVGETTGGFRAVEAARLAEEENDGIIQKARR